MIAQIPKPLIFKSLPWLPLGFGGAIYKKGGQPITAQTVMNKAVSGIYAIINPLGQTYIGQAIDWAKRHRKYRSLCCEGQPKIHRSLKQFGVEAHEFKLLTECSADLLDDFEFAYKQDFIDEKGWENALFCLLDDRKRDGISTAVAVSQYTKKGEWVADFASQGEAERETGINLGSISSAIKGRRKSAGGFLWAKQGEPCPKLTPRRFYGRVCTGQYNRRRRVAVLAYDSDNQLVGKWDTIEEAAEGLGWELSTITINAKLKRRNKGIMIKYLTI